MAQRPLQLLGGATVVSGVGLPQSTPMPPVNWEKLLKAMAEIHDLSSAVAVLSWDQETYMPHRGVAARSEQLATLQGLSHEQLVSDQLGDLIESLKGERSLTDTERAIVDELDFDRNRARCLPVDLVKAIARTQATALKAWSQARTEQNFEVFAPALTELLNLRRTAADSFGAPTGGERYDALLQGYEKGMRVQQLVPLFKVLGDWLSDTVKTLSLAPRPSTRFLSGLYDESKQWSFAQQLLEAMGFDQSAGRMDRSAHPFTTSFAPDDVRITIRTFEDLPLSSVFSTIHEAGHALYEQGLPTQLRRTVLCSAASMGLHESQSRLWENLVGRSLPFWSAFYPKYQELFSEHLSGVSLERFYSAVNLVEPSLIRVEADEVSYNLHIIVRFEIELALLRGELTIADLPGAWNDAYERYLGIRPPNDAQGVLQDIHWAWGEFGYFPTYTIGNLYSASLMRAARNDLPSLDHELQQGNLLPLRDWLRDKVHRHGRQKQADDIVRAVTGNGLVVDDFVNYLRTKYEGVYQVPLSSLATGN